MNKKIRQKAKKYNGSVRVTQKKRVSNSAFEKVLNSFKLPPNISMSQVDNVC